jgi:hypothetical protein
MRDPIADIGEFGHLLRILGVYAYPDEETPPGAKYEEYVFQFEEGSVVVTAVPDDDTITVAVGGATLPFVHELTGVEPWSRLIGCGVLWLWRMTNHRGYPDGCQIEFARPGEFWGVQLMCEASALTPLSLGPIDRLANQSSGTTYDHPPT